MNEHERPFWQAPPGPERGRPKLLPEQFMTELYATIKWLDSSVAMRGIRKKASFAGEHGHMPLSLPAFNGYLAANGVSWPPPPVDHFVYLVDGYDATVRWISDSLLTALSRTSDEIIGCHVNVLHPAEGTYRSEPDCYALWRAVKENQQEVGEYRTYFRTADDLWLPVNESVRYGQKSRYGGRNEIWFVDAVLTGTAMRPLIQEDSFINVDPSHIFRMHKLEPPETDEDGDVAREYDLFGDLKELREGEGKTYQSFLTRSR